MRPADRLRHGREFRSAYDRGARVVCRNFVAFVLRRGEGCLRLGVVASRRVGGAVARNRAKRVLREAFRRGSELRNVPADVVLVARRGIVGARYGDVQAEYTARVGKLLEKSR